jgi:hypothetical protein
MKKIKAAELRNIILQEAAAFTDKAKAAWPTPDSKYGDVANKAEYSVMKVGKEQAKLVSHSCATHVLMESEKDERKFQISERNSVGRCERHTLDEEGRISHYDVRFGDQLVRGIPVGKLVILQEKHHQHETRPKKSKKKSKNK